MPSAPRDAHCDGDFGDRHGGDRGQEKCQQKTHCDGGDGGVLDLDEGELLAFVAPRRQWLLRLRHQKKK